MNAIRDFAASIEAAGVSVLLLGGLPGSGKSPFSEEFENRGWLRFDNFQKNAPGDSGQFRSAARFAELVRAIAAGKRCVVTDIRFIYADYRNSAIRTLREVPGSHSVELRLFENDPQQCARNVGEAVDRDTKTRLENIEFWTSKYSLPIGAVAIPVLREPSLVSWEELAKRYREAGLVLAFGAGVSLGSGIPTWEELLLRIAGAITEEEEQGNEMFTQLRGYGFTLPAIASALENRYRAKGGRNFREIVREELYREFKFREGVSADNKGNFLRDLEENNKTLTALARLCVTRGTEGNSIERNPRVHAIVNFNLDSVFRTYVYHRFPRYVLRSVERASKESHLDTISVYYMHGFLRFDKKGPANEGADKVVFTEDEYFDFFNKPTGLFNYTFLYLLREHSCLFVGLSMIDDNIRRLLHYSKAERESAYNEEGKPHKAKDKTIRHFAILRRKTEQLSEVISESLENLGVKVLWVDTYSEIPSTLKTMCEGGGGEWDSIA